MPKKTKKPAGRPTPRTLTELTCLRCGYTWFPRRPELPKVCAKCVSPYWDKPKVRLTIMGRPKEPKKRVSKKPRSRKP